MAVHKLQAIWGQSGSMKTKQDLSDFRGTLHNGLAIPECFNRLDVLLQEDQQVQGKGKGAAGEGAKIGKRLEQRNAIGHLPANEIALQCRRRFFQHGLFGGHLGQLKGRLHRFHVPAKGVFKVVLLRLRRLVAQEFCEELLAARGREGSDLFFRSTRKAAELLDEAHQLLPGHAAFGRARCCLGRPCAKMNWVPSTSRLQC
mmetsp:Transcript_67793/g.150161  ORF Transcript_67793/g.150161 Transcript_67793/m.150161 type:complete len:201 (-) Transcript_67793:141-743(-)